MVNAKIATGAEQPINRDGATAGEEYEEGHLVGLNDDGYVVVADATEGINAVGVSMAPATDPDNYDDEYMPEIVRTAVEEKHVLVGRDKTAFAKYGFIVENSDEDSDFDVGKPVYLGDAGGFTQEPPVDPETIEQIVGFATDDGNAVFIDVETAYTEN